MAMISFTINNKPASVDVEPDTAIANAVARLTGKRLRHLPMSTDRVKKALA